MLFEGFFRFSELAGLTIKDIAISDSHLTIQVTRSKTDQYRKGDEVVIARSDKVTCPVLNLEKYMLLANIDSSKASSDYLFKPLVKVRSGFKVIEKIKPLSYTRARESTVWLLKEFVPDTANISLHSLGQGVLLQPTPTFLIVVGSAMVDSGQIRQRMAMLKTLSIIACLFLNT